MFENFSVLEYDVPNCLTYISAPLCFTEMGLILEHMPKDATFKMGYISALYNVYS